MNTLSPTPLASLYQVLEKQRQASHPHASVWVSASAGTGKTKVLTDRVLRLLLEGSQPQRILCLTFTKAAAAEMDNRLFDKLSTWTIAEDNDLYTSLETLTGRPPKPYHLKQARQLFNQVIDAPGGMRIQTIHAFCQSILQRFPLEAKVPPYSTVMDDQQAEILLKAAQDDVLGNLNESAMAHWQQVVGHLSLPRFRELIQELSNEQEKVYKAAKVDLYTLLNLDPAQEISTITQQLCDDHCAASLRQAMLALQKHGQKTDVERSIILDKWLSCSHTEDRQALLSEYLKAFLTQDGQVRKRLATNAVVKENIEIEGYLLREAERVCSLQQTIHILNITKLSQSLIYIASTILRKYESLKTQQAKLDYQDLINKTNLLLKEPEMAPWVLYKLDGGIDHILVDEAQDTNQSQWQVISALTEEFFAGADSSKSHRSLFVVGDSKQSIYSFQGADPQIFSQVRQHFSAWVKQASPTNSVDKDIFTLIRPVSKDYVWQEIELETSFRSTPAVLQAVDLVFKKDSSRKGVGSTAESIRHIPHRQHDQGIVEVWPLIMAEEIEESSPWEPPPLTQQFTASPRRQLANRIAIQIRSWLDLPLMLPGKNRPLQPADIMILVRKRGSFMEDLVTAMKAHSIPVSGVDRMMLLSQLAVQDLLAIGRFCLLPADDLTLATVLKSPFIGITEEQLFDLAQGRVGSLWQQLRRRALDEPTGIWETAFQWLKTLRKQARDLRPYEFYTTLLTTHQGQLKLQSRLGPDCLDPIFEFMNLSLAYERDHIPSLQGFISWLEEHDLEIKRDLDQGLLNQVRVMTVHGSKGLQAPIVILPDTVQPPQSDPSYLWTPEGGLIYAPIRAHDNALTQGLKYNLKTQTEEEYNRLLYVAMTRAEDHLYVCGWSDSAEIPENCWYNHIQRGLAETAQPFDLLDTQGGMLGTGWRLEDELISSQAEVSKSPSSPMVASGIPSWLLEPATREQPLTYTTPTQMAKEARAGAIEIKRNESVGYLKEDYQNQEGVNKALRGELIHELLNILPSLPTEKWLDQGQKILSLNDGQLTSIEAAEIYDSAVRVLQHPGLEFLWGVGSRGEVPIHGVVSGTTTLSGRIDRLVMRDNSILVVDFKTTPSPPAGSIPKTYVAQLEAYKSVLQQIYPGKTIEAGILWTANCKLQILEADRGL